MASDPDRSIAQQRRLLRAFAAAPDWVLHWINGGPKTIAGRVLDPRLRMVERLNGAQKASSVPVVEEARAATEAMHRLLAPERERGILADEVVIAGPTGEPLRLRCYRRTPNDEPRVCIVYAHFGGGVVGSIDTCDWFCSLLALRTGALVASVDYRLAPKHRFPAGYEDVLAAYRWARAPRQAGTFAKVAVAGDSIGGTFAAAIVADTARRGERPPDLQVLIYPALDLVTRRPSQELFARSFPLDGATADWFMAQYLPAEQDLRDLRISPGLFPTLGASAPAIIAGAGHDILIDQAIAYATDLARVGAPVSLLRFDSLCHGFSAMAALAPSARRACDEIVDAVHFALRTSEAIEEKLDAR
jgi:acetyl esterase